MVAIGNVTSIIAAAVPYLAVIETNPTALSGGIGMPGQCTARRQVYQIHEFPGGHPGSVSSGCSWKGNWLSSNSKQGMEGCVSGYNNGWRVCITSYGGNVHNGKGQHQRCLTDNTVLMNCPENMPCWTSYIRKLKCERNWYND